MVDTPDFQADQKRFFDRMAAAPPRDFVAQYKNRFVAFLDVLGFRNVMIELAQSTPHDLFHAIVDAFWFESATSTVDLRIWSDSIIIVSRDDELSSFISVANVINNLRDTFLERGLLLRGGVSFGAHFDEFGILISPALVEAVDLEKKASTPRIVCAPSVADRVVPKVTKNTQGRSGIVGPKYFHVLRDQLPIRDFDGNWVIEFLPDRLEPYFLRTGHHHDPAYTPDADQLVHIRTAGPKVLNRWRSGLLNARSRATASEHHSKIDYLIKKWNGYIASFKELDPEQKSSLQIEL
jgi:hypothetical protein